MKWVALAWRNVLRNKRRTTLAALIFAAGTIAVLSATGFVLASFHGLREATIAGQLGHLQIGAPGQFEGFEKTPLATGLQAAEVARIDARLAATPHVRFAMQRIMFEGLIAARDRTLAVVASGVEAQKESRLSGVFAALVAGDSLPAAEEPEQQKIIIAQELAKSLGVRPGDRVIVLATTEKGVLNGLDFEVAGIYRTGVPELDRRSIMIPLASAQALLDTAKVSRVVVVLDDTAATETVAAGLAAASSDFEVRTWIDLAPFYRQVVSLYGNIFGVLGGIIVVVVLLSVANAMLMSLLERVREQGTMRAFGIPAWRIRQNFVMEGAMVGLLGGVAGLAFSALLALAVNIAGIHMPPPPGRTTPYPLQIFVDPLAYGLTLGGMATVGVVAALLSLGAVRRMSILEQLNHY